MRNPWCYAVELELCSLDQWSSNCGLQTTSSSRPWELRNANSWAQPHIYWVRNSGWVLAVCVYWVRQWSWHKSKLEHHYCGSHRKYIIRGMIRSELFFQKVICGGRRKEDGEREFLVGILIIQVTELWRFQLGSEVGSEEGQGRTGTMDMED